MVAVDPDLFHRDELEYEIRARGRNRKGGVHALRKQLRESLSAGEKSSAFRVDHENKEIELCREKWAELRELAMCLENLELAPEPSRGCLLYTSRCV